ncbi:MAG: DUF1080 domain-containing protein [Verrucomicrobiae bacterium]|nr:DUF1080 domain-containing protein [Verrucomicrobiae bacterium]MDW7981017.1 DUF1080 domain-containing protein [Verrucomicrobiales bacterium]
MRTKLFEPGTCALIALVFAALSPVVCAAQQRLNPLMHDRTEPQPRVVVPPAPSTQEQVGRPPSDAVVLFDGRDLSRWVSMDGSPARWKVQDGYMECVPGAGSIRTLQNFGDCQLHIEWATPPTPKGTGQGRGNSGVFFGMDRYEVQVLDSYQNSTYADGSAGAIYGQYPPMVNASLPPGQWQTYDIVYIAPRFDSKGNLVSPAFITVFHNGVLVQYHAPLTGPTSWLERKPYEPHPEKLPISLQDHGDPIRYRNIWVRELGPPTRKELTLPRALLDTYAGVYERGRNDTIEIARHGDQLVATLAKVRFPLFAESETKFFAKTVDLEIEFIKDAQGKVDRLVYSVGEGASTCHKIK